MKSLNLLGISVLALSLNSCAMNDLLVYKEQSVMNTQARENLRKSGWKYVKNKKYCEAEIAFTSIGDLESLDKLAVIYLDENNPESAVDIYRFLDKCDYPVKPPEELLEELAKLGYKPKN